MNLKQTKRELKQKQLDVTLLGLEKAIKVTAKMYPSYAKLLNEKNIIAQIMLRDKTQGRYFIFKEGSIQSKSGFHSDPDVTMEFENVEIAVRLLNIKKDMLDFVSAGKIFQMGFSGKDENVIWFSNVMNSIFTAGTTYGVDMGEGIKRYTTCTNGGPLFVYVKDGKIIRITPIEFDESDAEPWTIKARGKTFTPPRKVTNTSYSLTWKSLVYSKDRLLYPMKRVDFDPNGERNPQNRGISGYERISWDEALDIVANEIKRVKTDYGPGSIGNSNGSHHTWGNVGYWLSAKQRFFNTIGSTGLEMNPDSWEGWYWGASHHWGYSARNGSAEHYGTVEDLLKNCEMIVNWSSDPEATHGVYAAHEGTIRRQWLKELGIKVINIDPYLNHTARMVGGKWMSPRTGTDNAMVFAIAYVWITENRYDKEYVKERTHGFEKWKEIVLGKDDGVPKTPEWQESITGVPAKDVRALAREWGSKRTYLAPGGLAGFGGACRTSTGTDWARGMVYLMAMQGLGKPGINLGNLQGGAPVTTRFYFPGYAEGGISGDFGGTASGVHMYQRMPHTPSLNTVPQKIPRLKFPDAIMDGHCEGYPTNPATIEGQFMKYGYPAPGHSTVKLYYKYGGSHIGTQTDTNRWANMYRSNALETVINQSIWFEGEAKFADIILPACTSFERWDIGESASCGGYVEHAYTQNNHRIIVMQHKCIEPLGESKADYQIFLEVAQKLGIGVPFSEGMTDLDWCKRIFDSTDLPNVTSWKDFAKKGYYVVPAPPEVSRDPVSFRWFAEGRQKDTPELTPLPGDYTDGWRYGLQTQTGKLEFESSSLKRFAPNDPERPPVMNYRAGFEQPNSDPELFAKYPLQLHTPHPRYTFHTQADGKDGTLNEIKDHRVNIDGYHYWIARMNSVDAKARGLKENDLIKLFNSRGAVICALQISERVRPGMVHSYESSSQYDPIGEPGKSPDRGGCVNILTPSRMIVKQSHAMAAMSCLIQVEKWKNEEGTNEKISSIN